MSYSEIIHGEPARSRVSRPSARGICFWYQSVNVARAAASCRYRIQHFVELTRGADVVIDERLPRSVARHTHTVVCLRPFITSTFERELAALRRSGIRLVADYDDLLFAGPVSGLPVSATGAGSDGDKLRRLARYAASLRVFDDFVVSTRALAQRLSTLAPSAKVTVVPNGLSEAWIRQGHSLYAAQKPALPVIRYFSGSPSHDGDIASILPPLRDFMVAQPQVQFEVVGHARVDLSTLPAGRARQLPSVSYEELPRLLGTTWVNLAPLVDSEFTACKSAIKFLEAAAFDCPTLASPNDDILRHGAAGASIVTCQAEGEWRAALEQLLDAAWHAESATQARRYVTARGMARAQVSTWLGALSPQGAP